MRMFLGEYQVNITEGARLSLPKKLRDQTGEVAILTRGFEKCLLGYAREDWEGESQKQLTAPISDAKARHLKQYFYSGAAEVSFDDQGRFVLPASLHEYGGIGLKAVVIGAGDHFEIWDEKQWRAHLAKIGTEVLGG